MNKLTGVRQTVADTAVVSLALILGFIRAYPATISWTANAMLDSNCAIFDDPVSLKLSLRKNRVPGAGPAPCCIEPGHACCRRVCKRSTQEHQSAANEIVSASPSFGCQHVGGRSAKSRPPKDSGQFLNGYRTGQGRQERRSRTPNKGAANHRGLPLPTYDRYNDTRDRTRRRSPALVAASRQLAVLVQADRRPARMLR